MGISGRRLTLLVVVLGFVGIAFLFQESRNRRQAPSSSPLASAKPQEKGSASAPIKVVAFYPLNEGHKFIADYLLKFAEEHPDQVYARVYDMQTPEGMKQWRSSGLKCAGVLVNGKTKHDIKRDGKTVSVDLVKRMGTNWQQGDFEALVKQLTSAKSN